MRRFDAAGNLTSSKEIASGTEFAMDANGNAYVAAGSDVVQHAKNSLATCGQDQLSVFAPDGSLLQGTFFAGALSGQLMAVGQNSTVFVVADADATFGPTQAGPFPAGGRMLVRLSPHSDAKTFPLACVVNAALYKPAPIAPGELVTLFGSGLGPAQGIQTQATLTEPYPTEAGGVEVTFDDRPAPLLWVQDGQINAVAPWSLTPGAATQICVSNNAVKTNCMTLPVEQTAPAVFTVDGFYARAINEDGSMNSTEHPAPNGSLVTVFATGLGPLAPSLADGVLASAPFPNNVLPVTVTGFETSFAGGADFTDFDISYAGPAPYMVAGVSQISFRVVSFYANEIYLTLPETHSPAFSVYVSGQ